VERFSGVLIEHYAGMFPLWLAPEQVRLAPVADRHAEHAQKMAEQLRTAGLRPGVDDSKETVGKKVRAAQLMKIPYTLVIGDREAESGNLAVRDRDGEETKDVAFDAFVAAVAEEAVTRSLDKSTF
jgi:threonyl-tRNA synthetase